MTDLPRHQCPLRTLTLFVPYAPLCTLFTGWAFRFKALSDGRRQILNFLLQQHIADVLGLSLAHTNKTLRKLERRGLHRIDGGRLYLRDARACVRLADLYGDGKPSPRPLI